MNKKIILFTTCFAFAASNSFATSNSDEIQELKKRILLLENKINNDQQQSNHTSITLSPIPSFKTNDGKTTFAFDGRMQLDAGTPTTGKSSSMNSNQTSVRRLWFGVTANVNHDWLYRFIVGFENNQTSIYDAFVKYSGFKNTDIMIGNFFENNGIDITTGNLATPLMERSSGITTFRQFRRTGISVNPHGDNFGLHLGVFGSDPSNSTTSAVNANNKGYGFSGRAHVDLINDQKAAESLHIGFNTTYRVLDRGTNSVTGSNRTMRFNSSGDSNVLNTILIDTGNITNVNHYYQNMAEFRFQKSSFTLTSEYIKTTINRTSGLGNVNFGGGYLMASYFLTGEKYGYDVKNGIQTLPIIGSKGAWEVATRYSTTNLNSKDIKGGKLDSYDFGISFYPNNNIKLMANYVINRADNYALVRSNPQYLMFRTQVSF